METEKGADPVSIGDLVGRNARALRTRSGLTRDDVARASRLFGHRWTVARVADIESGRSTPNLATLIVYCNSLAAAHLTSDHAEPVDVSLADLFAGDESVWLTNDFAIFSSAFRRILGGESAVLTSDDIPGAPKTPEELAERMSESMRVGIREAFPPTANVPPGFSEGMKSAVALFSVPTKSGLPDQRAAKTLGLTIYELAAWAIHLWGKTFSEERQERSGADADTQRKAQVTRTMMSELRNALGESSTKA